MSEATSSTTNEAVSLAFRWESIGSLSIDQAGKLVFPQAPSAPGVYRFEIDGDKALVYFGEAADLRQRFGQYRNPGRTQQTNLRMESLLCEILRTGGQSEVSLAQVISFSTGEPTMHLDLRLKAARVLVESSAIVLARGRGGRAALNLDKSFDRSLGER
jgi:hypothetical protein